MVDVSVIIPCYNRAATICRAISSVLDQDFEGVTEIIVSDDGSTDGSLDLIREKYHKNIIIIEKPVNCRTQGASGARNRGLEIATGKYIAFLDSDDYYYPSFLRTLFSELEENPRLGYVFCRVDQEIMNTDGSVFKPWTRNRMTAIDRKYHVLNRAHCICTICQMIRKTVIQKVGFFDNDLTVGEDSDMWIRLSEISEGKFIDYVGSVYCIVGFSDNQLTTTKNDMKFHSLDLVFENAKRRYIEKGIHDHIRLALIYKGIYLNKATQRNGIVNKIIRQLYIFSNMFWRLPISTIKIYINNMH